MQLKYRNKSLLFFFFSSGPLKMGKIIRHNNKIKGKDILNCMGFDCVPSSIMGLDTHWTYHQPVVWAEIHLLCK